jgi:hypothetical protein
MKIEMRAEIFQFDATGRDAAGRVIAIRVWGQDSVRNEFEIVVDRKEFFAAVDRFTRIYGDSR